jgi:Ca2+/Na+ antiporter
LSNPYPPFEPQPPQPPTYRRPGGGPAHAAWQPIQPGYGYPQFRNPAKPIRGLGTATQVLLVVQTLAALGLLIPVLHERDLVDRVRSGSGTVTLHEAQQADNTLSALSGAVTLLYLATGIVWIIWFYRARRNVEAWDASYQRHGPGWAIGGWICPVVSLWFPYVIAKDILDDTEETDPHRARQPRSRPLLLAWWLSFVALALIPFVERAQHPSTLDQLSTYTDIVIAGIVIRIVAACLAFGVVRQITNAQAARMAVPPPTPQWT